MNTKTWITSDLHFGHANIMNFCPKTRPYGSVSEMNQAMMDQWNAAVAPQDTVYILGDVAFMSGYDAAKLMQQLAGTKILVAGNHDRKTLKDVHFRRCFVSIHDYLEITHEKTLVVMSHYPFLEWNQMHRGSVMLYGHLHGNPTGQEQYRMRDVGMDASGSVVRQLGHVVADALTGEIKRHH
jgi:calcineurin-like phosphoesterase family protein